jgi:hypothetical protein
MRFLCYVVITVVVLLFIGEVTDFGGEDLDVVEDAVVPVILGWWDTLLHYYNRFIHLVRLQWTMAMTVLDKTWKTVRWVVIVTRMLMRQVVRLVGGRSKSGGAPPMSRKPT